MDCSLKRPASNMTLFAAFGVALNFKRKDFSIPEYTHYFYYKNYVVFKV